MATEIRITARKRHDGDQGISDAATAHLCQLGSKDQEEIAKSVGCNDGGVNEKTRKRLVLLIEENLVETLKGTREEQWEHLGGASVKNYMEHMLRTQIKSENFLLNHKLRTFKLLSEHMVFFSL